MPLNPQLSTFDVGTPQEALQWTEGMNNAFNRADKLKMEREEFNLRRDSLVQQQTINSLSIARTNLDLQKAQQEAALNPAKIEGEKVRLANEHAQNLAAIENGKSLSRLAKGLPDAARKLTEQVRTSSFIEGHRAVAAFLAQYGVLSEDKNYAGVFAEHGIPSVVSSKMALESRNAPLELDAATLESTLQVIMATSKDPEAEIKKLWDDPHNRDAFSSPGEYGRSLRSSFVTIAKSLREASDKLKQEQVKANNAEELAKNRAQNAADIRKEELDTKNSSERTVPGWEGQAPTTEEAVKFRAEVTNTEQIVKPLDEMMRLYAEYQKASTPYEKLKIMKLSEQAASMLVGNLRLPLTGPGAFTDSERVFVKDTVGDPVKFFAIPDLEVAKVAAMRKKLVGGVEIMGKNLGYKRSGQKAEGDQGSVRFKTTDGKVMTGKRITTSDGRQGVMGDDGNFYPLK